MKSSFSTLLKDEKGTKYKPQSLVDLVKKNTNKNAIHHISKFHDDKKTLAFLGKDLLTSSNDNHSNNNNQITKAAVGTNLSFFYRLLKGLESVAL